MKRIVLYATCIVCDGHGRVAAQPGDARTMICGDCRGKGFLPTKDGRAIIGLVKIAKVEGLLPETWM